MEQIRRSRCGLVFVCALLLHFEAIDSRGAKPLALATKPKGAPPVHITLTIPANRYTCMVVAVLVGLGLLYFTIKACRVHGVQVPLQCGQPLVPLSGPAGLTEGVARLLQVFLSQNGTISVPVPGNVPTAPPVQSGQQIQPMLAREDPVPSAIKSHESVPVPVVAPTSGVVLTTALTTPTATPGGYPLFPARVTESSEETRDQLAGAGRSSGHTSDNGPAGPIPQKLQTGSSTDFSSISSPAATASSGVKTALPAPMAGVPVYTSVETCEQKAPLCGAEVVPVPPVLSPGTGETIVAGSRRSSAFGAVTQSFGAGGVSTLTGTRRPPPPPPPPRGPKAGVGAYPGLTLSGSTTSLGTSPLGPRLPPSVQTYKN